MKVHDLKTWREPFEAMVAGRKTHEVRFDDGRGFEVGDTLILREWVVLEARYTGRWVRADVHYISRGPEWGLPVKHAVVPPRNPSEMRLPATVAVPMVVMSVKPWQLRLDGPTDGAFEPARFGL